jgi:hypothetical protein
MLTRLTIDIDLVTPWGKPRSREYSTEASNAMKSLCLALAGASKLQELSIVVRPGEQDSSDVDLAEILWPLLVLRSGIAVNFEGITGDSGKTSRRYEGSPEIDAAFCRRIALVRRLCNSEFERPGWEERCWVFHGLRDAEKILYALKAPGKKVLCLEDIVNMSPVWKAMRREIDRVEATSAKEQ